jgi:hypothetical protein
LSIVMAMFPRSLPRAAQRSVAAAAAAGRTYNPQEKAKKSFAGQFFNHSFSDNNHSNWECACLDFKATMRRLLKNKVLVCNCLSSVSFIFGLIGQWTFMPKYMETQFHQSASTAALISGDYTCADYTSARGPTRLLSPDARRPLQGCFFFNSLLTKRIGIFNYSALIRECSLVC